MDCDRFWFISLGIRDVLGSNTGGKLLDVVFVEQTKRIDSEIVHSINTCLGGFLPFSPVEEPKLHDAEKTSQCSTRGVAGG